MLIDYRLIRIKLDSTMNNAVKYGNIHAIGFFYYTLIQFKCIKFFQKFIFTLPCKHFLSLAHDIKKNPNRCETVKSANIDMKNVLSYLSTKFLRNLTHICDIVKLIQLHVIVNIYYDTSLYDASNCCSINYTRLVCKDNNLSQSLSGVYHTISFDLFIYCFACWV